MTESATDPEPHSVVAKTPSIHVRAFITWLVIFPEVALVNWLLSPTGPLGEIVLKSFIVTAVVIPPAIYLFVPALLRAWSRISKPRRS